MPTDLKYPEFEAVTSVAGSDTSVGYRSSNPPGKRYIRPTYTQVATYINGQITADKFIGDWNASTNSPTLSSGVGTKGNYYRVSTDGSTTLDGLSTWRTGDLVWFDGTVWRRLNGASSPDFEFVSVDNISLNGGSISIAGAGFLTTSGSPGSLTLQTNGAGSPIVIKAVSTNINLIPNTSFPVRVTQGRFEVENISFNNNDITTLNANGNLNITPNGNGRVNFGKALIHETAALLSVVAATGIVSVQDEIVPVESSTAGDTTVTANPQIALGIEGERRTIIGTDDVKTVTFSDGNGLKLLQSPTVTLANGHSIEFVMRGGVWVEENRNPVAVGASTSPYSTIGTGGDYATVQAAVADSKTLMRLVSNVTESVNNSPTSGAQLTIDLNGFEHNLADTVTTLIGASLWRYAGIGDIKQVATTAAKKAFDVQGTSVLDWAGVRNADNSGNTGAGAGWAVFNTPTTRCFVPNEANFIAPNGATFGFDKLPFGSKIGRVKIIGAGVSTSGFITNGNEVEVAECVVDGTVSTTTDMIEINSSGGATINNVKGLLGAVKVTLTAGSNHKCSQHNNVIMSTGTCTAPTLTDCNFFSLDMSSASNNQTIMNGCVISGNTTIGGQLTTGSSNKFLGNLTVNGNNNSMDLTTVSGTYIDNGSLNAIRPPQPIVQFKVRRTTSATNVTGDGTVYTIVFESEDYDTSNSMSTTTFTAPVKGYYKFGLNFGVGAVAATRGINATIQINSVDEQIYGTTTTAAINPFRESGTVKAFLDLSQTALCEISVSLGGSLDVSVLADTIFYGELIEATN